MVPSQQSNIPTFHHSSLPRLPRATNPLDMITHAYFKDRFWARVIWVSSFSI